MPNWAVRIEDTETMTAVSVGPFPTRVDALEHLHHLHDLVRPKAYTEPIVEPEESSSAVAMFLRAAQLMSLADGSGG